MDMSIYRDEKASDPAHLYDFEEYDRKSFLIKTINKIAKNELTAKQYKIYKMYYKEKMKMKEIAENEGVTLSAVSKIIKRIEKRLKKYAKYVNVK